MIIAGVPRNDDEKREVARFIEDLRVLLMQFGELRVELKLATMIHVITKSAVATEIELGHLVEFVAGSYMAAEERKRGPR